MLSLSSAVELSKLDFIESLNARKAEVEALRPLPPETEQRIMQKLRLDWNYHSNSIEGNQLSYGETVAFLMHGLTAKGKPLKDHLDIRGHNQAIEFLTRLVKDERGISEADIRALHKLILVEPYEVDALTPEGNPTKKWIRLGEYKRESNSVKTQTGETHFYATPEETPARMEALMAWLSETKATPDLHPLVVAAQFHHEFTAIHPFDDGNGRMARLLSNLNLMQSGYPPVVVKQDNRDEYYSVLSQADAGSFVPVVEYFGGLLTHSLEIYLRGAKGENIEEESDVDKEIALFKASVDLKILERMPRSDEVIKQCFIKFIYPVIEKIRTKNRIFDDLFYSNKAYFYTPTDAPNPDEMPIVYYSDNAENPEIMIEDLINVYKTYVGPYDEYPNEEISSIIFVNDWRGYKPSENHFSISSNIEISFDQYRYSIFVGVYPESSKFIKHYNEGLSKREIFILCNESAKYSLEQIRQTVDNF